LPFYLTADTGLLELEYRPAEAVAASRALAFELAELSGYEFAPWDGSPDAEPGRCRRHRPRIGFP